MRKRDESRGKCFQTWTDSISLPTNRTVQNSLFHLCLILSARSVPHTSMFSSHTFTVYGYMLQYPYRSVFICVFDGGRTRQTHHSNPKCFHQERRCSCREDTSYKTHRNIQSK
ncbi:hypothetical protein ABVT39_010015 [Epinephelus coioides]